MITDEGYYTMAVLWTTISWMLTERSTNELKSSAAGMVKGRVYELDIRLTSLDCYPKIHGFQDLGFLVDKVSRARPSLS